MAEKFDMNDGKPVYKSILVLISTPILAAILVPWYGFTYGFVALDWFWFAFFMLATGISITMGYHRLWSHKSFKANAFIRFILMFFGAASLQNSIIQWCSDHRKHHRYVDNPEKDPYAATRGFFYSHIGWMLRYNKDAVERIEGVDDLYRDKIVRFQHQHYVPIAVFSSAGLPLIIGWTYGSAIGCFLLAGLLRVVLNHHFTFFINSLAHTVGAQKFSLKNTSRDNALVSLVTYGEGYHNFHHTFAGDYRNGINWYDFDPSKWLISLSKRFGWCWGLKKTPTYLIELTKAKVQLAKMYQKLRNSVTSVQILKKNLQRHHEELNKTLSQWAKARQAWLKASKDKLSSAQVKQVKQQSKLWKKEFKKARHKWRKDLANLKSVRFPHGHAKNTNY